MNKLNSLKGGLLPACLLIWAATGSQAIAQNAPAQEPPAPPPSTTPAPPPSPPRIPETPSTVNTGTGFSIEPIYWRTAGSPSIHKGSQNTSTNPGDLDYPSSANEALGGIVTVPAGKTGAVRVSYFQAKSSGGTAAASALHIFGSDITASDPLAMEYKLTNFKISYDFLTYFFKRGSTEFRVKTLWGVQYLGISNTIDDFTLQDDGSYTLNSIVKDKTIIYPDFGIGIEHTINPHIRWEAKGSGFAFPHKSVIGDAEASINFRFGHIELIGGARMYHFKSSPNSDNYVSGTIYGPYAGLRYYWKGTKQPAKR